MIALTSLQTPAFSGMAGGGEVVPAASDPKDGAEFAAILASPVTGTAPDTAPSAARVPVAGQRNHAPGRTQNTSATLINQRPDFGLVDQADFHALRPAPEQAQNPPESHADVLAFDAAQMSPATDAPQKLAVVLTGRTVDVRDSAQVDADLTAEPDKHADSIIGSIAPVAVGLPDRRRALPGVAGATAVEFRDTTVADASLGAAQDLQQTPRSAVAPKTTLVAIVQTGADRNIQAVALDVQPEPPFEVPDLPTVSPIRRTAVQDTQPVPVPTLLDAPGGQGVATGQSPASSGSDEKVSIAAPPSRLYRKAVAIRTVATDAFGLGQSAVPVAPAAPNRPAAQSTALPDNAGEQRHDADPLIPAEPTLTPVRHSAATALAKTSVAVAPSTGSALQVDQVAVPQAKAPRQTLSFAANAVPRPASPSANRPLVPPSPKSAQSLTGLHPQPGFVSAPGAQLPVAQPPMARPPEIVPLGKMVAVSVLPVIVPLVSQPPVAQPLGTVPPVTVPPVTGPSATVLPVTVPPVTESHGAPPLFVPLADRAGSETMVRAPREVGQQTRTISYLGSTRAVQGNGSALAIIALQTGGGLQGNDHPSGVTFRPIGPAPSKPSSPFVSARPSIQTAKQNASQIQSAVVFRVTVAPVGSELVTPPTQAASADLPIKAGRAGPLPSFGTNTVAQPGVPTARVTAQHTVTAAKVTDIIRPLAEELPPFGTMRPIATPNVGLLDPVIAANPAAVAPAARPALATTKPAALAWPAAIDGAAPPTKLTPDVPIRRVAAAISDASDQVALAKDAKAAAPVLSKTKATPAPDAEPKSESEWTYAGRAMPDGSNSKVESDTQIAVPLPASAERTTPVRQELPGVSRISEGGLSNDRPKPVEAVTLPQPLAVAFDAGNGQAWPFEVSLRSRTPVPSTPMVVTQRRTAAPAQPAVSEASLPQMFKPAAKDMPVDRSGFPVAPPVPDRLSDPLAPMLWQPASVYAGQAVNASPTAPQHSDPTQISSPPIRAAADDPQPVANPENAQPVKVGRSFHTEGNPQVAATRNDAAPAAASAQIATAVLILPAAVEPVRPPVVAHGAALRMVPKGLAVALVKSAVCNDPGRVELTLDPIELGKVRFALVHSGDQIQVTLSVERPETLDLLRRHADELRADFRDAGFQGASFSFNQFGQGKPDPQRSGAPDPDFTATDPESQPAAQPFQRERLAGQGLDLRL